MPRGRINMQGEYSFVAIEENNKKKPDRLKRYRSLYDAYRDDTSEEDEQFWSSLNAGRDADENESDGESERIAAGGNPERKTAKRSAAVDGSEGRTIRKSEAGDEPSVKSRRAAVGGESVTRSAAKRRAVRIADDEDEEYDSAARRRAEKRKRAQERKLRRGRRFYLVFLFLWGIALVCGGVWLWRYTGRCLNEYEQSQPENNVDRLLQEYVAKVRNGSIEGELTFFEETDDWKLPSEFENENYLKDMFFDKLESVTTFTCVKNKNSYSTTNPIYDILGDGKVVARMRMVSYNPKKILAILEVCEWKIDTISIDSDIFMELLDIDSDNLNTTDYVYTVPEGYKITVNGRELTEQYVVKTSEIPKELEYVKDYIDFPVNVTYRICELLNRPEVVVKDTEGNPVDVVFDDKGCFSITYEVKTGLEAPQERYDLGLLTAQKWMDFVTDDLTGKNHGLEEIRKYLLKGSLFYVKSEEYGKGIDIKFISAHTIDDPEYTDLEVTEYKEYTENCFSIHVYFVKNMRLIKSNHRRVTSTFDSTLYFLYYDDSDDGVDNPHWTLADMIAGARQNYGGDEDEEQK